jgi:hypothetical protein
MKVYIGKNEAPEEFKRITEPGILNYVADDSECEIIVLDGVLKKMPIDNVANYLMLARKKLRLNGVLTVKDLDFDILSYIHQRNSDLASINKAIFQNGSIESVFNFEYILQILSNNMGLELQVKNLEGLDFILTFRRVS